LTVQLCLGQAAVDEFQPLGRLRMYARVVLAKASVGVEKRHRRVES
jgi:hypothetical protein